MLVVTALLFSGPKSVYAGEDFKPSPWTRTHPYFQQASHKLGFGLLNLGSSPLALFYEPTRGNFFTGCGRGLWYAVAYCAGGAIHAVTFPIPVDLPLPEGGIHFRN